MSTRPRSWLVALFVTAALMVTVPVAAQSSQPQRLRPRDSLRNGAFIGTVLGAAALGVLAAALCHAYQEEGGASCVPDTLRFAAVGGAIGAGAGLAIDAARDQRGVTVRFTLRF